MTKIRKKLSKNEVNQSSDNVYYSLKLIQHIVVVILKLPRFVNWGAVKKGSFTNCVHSEALKSSFTGSKGPNLNP